MSRIAYSQKKNTVCLLTATALFLLVGILQYFDDFVSQRAVKEAMNLAACIILIGLAVVWAFCMYNRITPKRLQRSILLLAVFVVMLLVLRFIKYRFFKTNDIVMRHLWYAYYIPQTSIPALAPLKRDIIRSRALPESDIINNNKPKEQNHEKNFCEMS